MRKETKAVKIPRSVKGKVWERDGYCCVWCGNSQSAPVAHFIPRVHGGLGVEENILTLCTDCHYKYDHTTARGEMMQFFRLYLNNKYPDWKEEDLIYRKENGC